MEFSRGGVALRSVLLNVAQGRRPGHASGSDPANAIHFAVSDNTATLNLSADSGENISLGDPIASAAEKAVTVNASAGAIHRRADRRGGRMRRRPSGKSKP